MIRKIGGGLNTAWRREVKLTCVLSELLQRRGKLVRECSDIRLTQNWDPGLSEGWILGIGHYVAIKLNVTMHQSH